MSTSPEAATLVMDPLHVEEKTEPESEPSTGSSPRQEEEMMPPKKKQKAMTYMDIDPAMSWITKIMGKNNYSGPNISVFTQNGAPRFAFFTVDEPRERFAFKMDLEPQNNPPSFLTGLSSTKTTEGLDMSITLNENQKAFLYKVEEWIKMEAVTHSKEWFGREFDKSGIEAMYTSTIKEHERFSPTFRARINLAGADKFLTKIAFMKDSGEVINGAGWKFVEPLLGSNAWRGYEVRAYVELRSIWVVNKKFGPRFNFTDLLVVETEGGSSRTATAAFPELGD